MTRRRVLTDEQCKNLAAWFSQLRALGSVQAKCRELGVSRTALYDAIARDQPIPASATGSPDLATRTTSFHVKPRPHTHLTTQDIP